MARKKVTHSEDWWALIAPPYVLRCSASYKSTGLRCRREAKPGANVCDRHGALAPQTVKAAAVRLQMTADDAAKQLVSWMNDPSVDMRERVKIAQDLLDRSGVSGTSKLVLSAEDPIDALFRDILSDPDGLAAPAAPQLAEPPTEAALARWRALEAEDSDDDVMDAEVLEDDEALDATEVVNSEPPAHLRKVLARYI